MKVQDLPSAEPSDYRTTFQWHNLQIAVCVHVCEKRCGGTERGEGKAGGADLPIANLPIADQKAQ